ncbi:hypothetical protein SASPL_130111 [Salvia splendens]|uniref:VQ domain-containing protein n=1 Tax=Salvia splendens TaxID=180675 RepID=A0A8X8ZJQ3_SALSN|nr:hypothetical protein SASPL_130111 [Salvia splendens]
MGKKSKQSSPLTKQEKKQQSNNTLMKMLKPKVFITDSSNFKSLVQQLTGNEASSPPPPPRIHSAASPPPPHAYRDVSFDSSLEGSPDLRAMDSFDYGFDLSSQIVDLEEILMGIDSINYSSFSGFDSCSYANIQQEVCKYDYDFSGLI